jgi:hypothetical protein
MAALVRAAGVEGAWHAEVAAMLSQVGYVILPPSTIEKYFQGEPLSAEEEAMLARVPEVTAQIVANIPRLDPVLEILNNYQRPFKPEYLRMGELTGEAIPWGARALRIAIDLDILETQSYAVERAFDTLRGRDGLYDPRIVEKLAVIRNAAQREQVRDLSVDALKVGMRLVEDVRTQTGLLVVARGNEITLSLLERLHNMAILPGLVEPLRIAIPLRPPGSGAERG